MAMSYDTPVGSKVVVTAETARNGYTHDKHLLRQYCSAGQVYTIAASFVEAYRTEILLEEIPGVRFNSVNFEVARTTEER